MIRATLRELLIAIPAGILIFIGGLAWLALIITAVPGPGQ